jgi:hypothetical protein
MDWIGAQCGVVMGSTNLSMTTLEESIADVNHKEAKKIEYKSCGMQVLQLQ